MKRLCPGLIFILSIGFLLAPVKTNGQAVILSENFNGTWSTANPPAGWEIIFTDDTSTNDWHRAPDLGFNPWSENPTPYAVVGPGEEGEDWLITPYLNLIGCDSVVLRCSLGFTPGTGYAEAKILAAVDSGPFTIEIANFSGQTIAPGLITYHLPWATNQRGVRFAFSLLTQADGIAHWVIDNFSITAKRRATDVGLLQLVAPRDTVDSNAQITPSCRVTNLSRIGIAEFWTVLTIADYQDSVWTANLAPGETTTINFRTWIADTAGIVSAFCATQLPGDLNPENDTVSRRVFVKPPLYHDVAAREILAPRGEVIENSLVIPRGVIANYGNQPATLKAYLEITILGSPIYSDSITHHLLVNQTDTVSFTSWIATPPGTYTVFLRVNIAGDLNPENNSVSITCLVRSPVHDIGAGQFLSPLDTTPPGPIIPQVTIVNYGTFAEANFKTYFTAYRAGVPQFSDSVTVTAISPGETIALSFRAWNAAKGTYLVSCSTALAEDNDPTNDRAQKTVLIRRPLQPGWQEMTSLPVGAEEVKAGGALAHLGNHIYALRGNKTSDFLRYDIDQDSWAVLDPVPPGEKGKPVYKGGALTSDRYRYIYATVGNSQASWYRFDAALDTWQALEPVPPGPTNKPIKGGTRMVYIVHNDTGYVYLLKGYKDEFWRYNTVANRWDSLPSAPAGPSGKNKYGEGSFIVFDGNQTIYAVKAKYNEVFAYDVNLNQWLNITFQKFPLAGRSGKQKKVKDGAGGDWWHRAMYCLKGGNTCEFWRFFPAENRWEELDTIPAYGSTEKKKRIKAGGAIVSLGNGIFFALKGNKTNEFWCYKSPESGPGVTEPSHPLAPVRPMSLHLYPNPARNRVLLEISAPRREKTILNIYDRSGRLCQSFITDAYRLSLNLQKLRRGVYLITAKTQSGFARATAKLIIQ